MSTTSGTGGVSYRNGTQRSSLRTQSSASTSSGGQKASVKSKSVLRKSSPAALGGGSSKSGGGGDAGGKNKNPLFIFFFTYKFSLFSFFLPKDRNFMIDVFEIINWFSYCC